MIGIGSKRNERASTFSLMGLTDARTLSMTRAISGVDRRKSKRRPLEVRVQHACHHTTPRSVSMLNHEESTNLSSTATPPSSLTLTDFIVNNTPRHVQRNLNVREAEGQHLAHTLHSLHSHARDVPRVPRSQTRFRVAIPQVETPGLNPCNRPRLTGVRSEDSWRDKPYRKYLVIQA